MNPSRNVSDLSRQFSYRLNKKFASIGKDAGQVESYCIFAIHYLNSFLRSYLISIGRGAINANHQNIRFASGALSKEDVIDCSIQFGFPGRYRSGNIGLWKHDQEPAFHNPRVFLNIINGLNPNNRSDIISALSDSWKIDTLRSVRNYFAHRCKELEDKAKQDVVQRYQVAKLRGNEILLQTDTDLNQKPIEDIHEYLINFANRIGS